MSAAGTVVRRAVAALLLTAVGTVAQRDVTRTGKTFVVTLHPGKTGDALAARLADEALAAAESVRPVLEKCALKPAKTPAIHVYAVEEEYRVAEAEWVAGGLRLETCVHPGGTAHVLLPVLDPVDFGLIGLPPPTAHHVMLVAVQLAVFDRCSWVKIDPWRAGVVAHGVVDEILNPDAVTGVDPMFDDRRYWLAGRFARGKAPTLRDCLDSTESPEDRADFNGQQEVMGVVACTLGATGSGWARKFLATPDEKLRGLAAQRAAAVESILGKDWTKNEARFRKVLSSLHPRFVVTKPIVALRDGRILLVGNESNDGGATLTALEPPAAGAYAIRATCELVPSRTRDLRVLLDWDETSLLACFVQDNSVWIAHWENGATDWKNFVTAKSPVVAARPFRLSVEVDTKLRVVIDDKQVLEFDYGKRTMRGSWSVAKNLGPVWLQDLRCEPLAPAKKK